MVLARTRAATWDSVVCSSGGVALRGTVSSHQPSRWLLPIAVTPDSSVDGPEPTRLRPVAVSPTDVVTAARPSGRGLPCLGAA